MKNLQFLLVFTALIFFVSCLRSEREFPLYKMNVCPSEHVSVGGILADSFYSAGKNRVLDSTAIQPSLDLVSFIELAESYANTGNKDWLRICEAAWDSIHENECLLQMHRNASIDSEWIEEWLNLNSVLLRITANPKYGDEFEKTIYNVLLGNYHSFDSSLIPDKMAPSFYTRYLDQVYVNVFGSSSMEYEHTTGGKIRIVQNTKYPYDGLVKLKFETDDKRYIDLHIRIPEWAKEASITVGGVKYKAVPGQYARVTKKWKTGNEVEIILPMRPFVYKQKLADQELFSLEYGTLKMASQIAIKPEFTSIYQSRGGDPYQFLDFLSPPGEVPTFTFKGYQDTTLVFQPYYFLEQNDNNRSVWFPWL